jgi:hypothetical protein
MHPACGAQESWVEAQVKNPVVLCEQDRQLSMRSMQT